MIGVHWNSASMRRGIFMAANFAALLGFVVLIVWPVQDFFAGRDARIAGQRALLARFTAIAAQRTTVEGLAAQSTTGQQRSEFLRGANDGVATANFQTMLKGMVEPTGARLRSMRALPTTSTENIKFIGAQLDMTGTMQALYQAVRTIEAAKPFLFIVNTQLRPTQQAAATPGARSTEPTVDAQIDVVGAMESPGGM
jgi:general secretion pathway protein M